MLSGGGSEESLNCKRPNGTNGAIGTIRAFGLYTTKETATLCGRRQSPPHSLSRILL